MEKKKWTYEEGRKFEREGQEKEKAKLTQEIRKLQRLVARLRRSQPKLGLWAIRSGSILLHKKYLTKKEATKAAKYIFKPDQLKLIRIIEI